jgi:hypothetical protein
LVHAGILQLFDQVTQEIFNFIRVANQSLALSPVILRHDASPFFLEERFVWLFEADLVLVGPRPVRGFSGILEPQTQLHDPHKPHSVLGSSASIP